MTPVDDTHLRVLHAVRLLGYAANSAVSARANVAAIAAEEALLDAQAAGHVTWSEFAGDGGGRSPRPASD